MLSRDRLATIPWRLLLVPAALGVVVVAAATLLPLQHWSTELQLWLAQLGPRGRAVFVVLFGLGFVLGTATVLPAGPFSIAAGALFGLGALPFAVAAATLGGAASFAIARRFLRAAVLRTIETRPLLRAIDTAIAVQGGRIVFLVRLSPLVPFNVQNYVFGVTKIRWLPYLLATAFGILPSTALYVYVGSLGRSSLMEAGWGALLLPAIGLLCSFAAVALVGIAAQRALLRAVAL